MAGEFIYPEQHIEAPQAERAVWYKKRFALLDLIKNKRTKKAILPLSLITALQTACAGELSQKDLANHPFPQEAPEVIQQKDGTYCLDVHSPVCRSDHAKNGQQICTCLNNLLPHEQDAIERLQLAARAPGVEGPLKRYQEREKPNSLEQVIDQDLIGEMGEHVDTVTGFETLGLDNQILIDLLKTLPGSSIESIVYSEICPAGNSNLEPGQVLISNITDHAHSRSQVTFYSPACQGDPRLVQETQMASMGKQIVMAYVDSNDYFNAVNPYPDKGEKGNQLDIELRDIIKPTINPNLPIGPNLPSAYGGPTVPADEYTELYNNSAKQCPVSAPETKYQLRRKRFLTELLNAALNVRFRFPSQDWRHAFKEQLVGQYQTENQKADKIVNFIGHIFDKMQKDSDPNKIIRDFQSKEQVLNIELAKITYKKEVQNQINDAGLRALLLRAVDEPSGAVHPLMIMDEFEKKSLYSLYAPEIHRQVDAEERLSQRIQDQNDQSLSHLLQRLEQICKDLLAQRRQAEHLNANSQNTAEFSRHLKLFNTYWSGLAEADKTKYKPYIIHFMRIKYYGDGMMKLYE